MAQNKPLIKVGILVSYDYDFIKNCLPIVYPYADQIAFAIDKDRKTWNGEQFDIPDTFFEWVKEYDSQNKIRIYEDVFHVPELSAMECDTRERNLLSQFMGEGGWHIQVDSDEYFLDFKGFVEYLYTLDVNKKRQIYASWITMFKKDENNVFISYTNEKFPVATSFPFYRFARRSKSKRKIRTDFKVLHQSWAREDREIEMKIRNWGHTVEFDTNAYYDFWKAINKQTYKYVKNFHPLSPEMWASLECFEIDSFSDLMDKVKVFLEKKEQEKKELRKIQLRDFIPPVLYKLKAKFK